MTQYQDSSTAPRHPREAERLKALESLGLFGTHSETRFDEIVSLLAQTCGAKTALLTLVGEDSLWFKSRYNYKAESAPRDGSFCSHAILHDEVMVIEDASQDPRFENNPLVVCPDTSVRFYAGAPLLTEDGLPLGVVCVIDDQPRSLNNLQVNTLKVMANQLVAQMSLGRSVDNMRALNQNKDKFLALIAHDLKAAFHGILGFSEVLDFEYEDLDDEARRKIASYLNDASQSTYRLLEDLLEWARIENGSMPYRPKQLLLNKVIEQTIAALQITAAQKHIRLESSLRGDHCIYGDDNMLHSLIHNLVSNALKFTPEYGSVQIFDQLKDGQVTLHVQDSGIGMTPEQLQRLFKVEASHSTTGTKGETGTGLGLLLCKQFVQQHKGTIQVKSMPGQGSTFSVTLPLVTQHSTETAV